LGFHVRDAIQTEGRKKGVQVRGEGGRTADKSVVILADGRPEKPWTRKESLVFLHSMTLAKKRKKPRASVAKKDKEGAPVVCRAGLFQFAARQRFTNGSVQSIALFWCKNGRGEFDVDGVTYPLEPHDLYVLPWNRRISYRPSPQEPMFTGHVHIVPWYRPGASWLPNVPHEPGDPEFDSPDRSDEGWPLGGGVLRLHTQADEPLGRLVDYAIRWFLHSTREENEARALGLLLVQEVVRTAQQAAKPAASYPEELRRLLVHLERGFHLAPRIEDLALIVGRSRSHVLKLFRKHMGVSAKGYIVGCQLREARELLLSTTLPISEVGKAAGISDPYHFSKLFKRHVGLSPREFRAEHGPFSTPPKPSRHQTVPEPTET
jgi:AraC-like DNA-binding protein